MAEAPSYTVTNNSIVVIWHGKSYNITKDSPQFGPVKKVLHDEDWGALPQYLTVTKSIESWAKGKFTLQGGTRFMYGGEEIPGELNARIVAMATAGDSPMPLFNFWERLQKNPSMRSVSQLWPFLQHQGIPLTADGHFLAYKGVKQDYTDKHTGTVSNHPGVINEMPRNKISDDPRVECHYGYHVGAFKYATTFAPGGRVVVCKVDPADVVCIPYDEGQQKMRVCKYQVIGLHNGELLPNTVYEEDVDVSDLEGGTQEEEAPVEATPEEAKPEKPEIFETQAEKDAVTKAPTAPKALPQKRAPYGFAKIHRMDMHELLKQPLEELRRYASKGLSIVGASKIPGGKVGLIQKIVKERE